MTDQNVAYRNDADNVVDEDPLAELARIVAGDPEPKKPEPVKAVEPAPAAEAEFDIEAELMRELGEAESGHVSEEQEPVEEAFAPAMPPRSQATPVASQAHHEEEMSIEDQLMAELSNDDFEEVNTVKADPVDQIEAVAAELKVDVEPIIEPTVNVDHDATTVSAVANDVVEDDLEDFFSDGFSDLLEEEVAEQAAPVKAKSLATPQINEPIAAQATDIDDLESQFEDAFAAEMDLDQPEPAKPEISIEPDLEADFAKAFEEQMQFDAPELQQPVQAQAIPQAAIQPEARYDDRLSNDAAFEDFEDENIAAAPLAPKPSRSGFKLAVGALCAALVVGLGVVGWGAMNGSGNTSGEPTIIKADSEPIKVKPEEPGGKKIENQDNQVYTKVAGAETDQKVQEELISSREQVSEDAKATNRLAPKAETNEQQATLGISPKKVRTLTVKPDGTIVRSEPETPAPAATPAVSSAPVEATTPAAEESVLASIDGASSTGELAIPTPSPLPAPEQTASVNVAPAPKPAAPKPAAQPVAVQPAPAAVDPNAPTQIANLNAAPASATPSVSSSEWKVQVSSQRSRDAAEASFKNIQGRFASVLSGRSANIERADVDGKGTFYRVKILADSKSAASDICSRLKSAGGSCFVTR